MALDLFYEQPQYNAGMDIRHQIDEPFTTSIAPYTVAFLGVKDDATHLFGTGILLQVGDKHFIVSAAHVLDFATIHQINVRVGYHVNGSTPFSLSGAGI